MLIFVWAASGLFVEVQGALRVIYDIGAERMRGIANAVSRRLVTVAAVIASALMLAILVAGATAAAWLRVEWAARGFGWLVSAAVLTGGSGARVPLSDDRAPALEIRWSRAPWSLDCRPGGRAGGWGCSSPGEEAAELLAIAGSLVAVLLAVYVLSNVILFGAALTKTAAAAADPNLSRL